ncbi:NAD-glutamate dehydrogenase [Vitreoscilla stercoraria]|uniref:NAD-glutamate dehydrogenase n=1 Tax=Vitreoscilla stercoraria TaxID=61 RepID=A0ABY4EDI1_VITST|nr:NAD-glutamate dehydrogenase [Vitreoscilla stercoraria]UOO93512.1 NAD-glutamate dehydrogenase [Vitreoscilla stercoraria]
MTMQQVWQTQLHAFAQEHNINESSQTFLQIYYEDVDSEDLATLDMADLVSAARSHQQTAARPRQSGESHVEVLQQTAHADFAANETIINIVFDDLPFLIDSLILLLNQRRTYQGGELVQLKLLVHPIFTIKRNEQGELQNWSRSRSTDNGRESWVQIRLNLLSDEVAAQLKADIEGVLKTLYKVVDDEGLMRRTLSQVVTQVQQQWHKDNDEILAFLNWLSANHFLFMGFCEYDLVTDVDGQQQLQIHQDSCLGMFQLREEYAYSTGFQNLESHEKQAWLDGPRLVLSKSQQRSNIHRAMHYDLIGIHKINAAGEVVGQWRFLGLYTSQTYLGSVWDIPIVRQKCRYVVQECDYVSGGYKDKMLHFILQTYPRDELLQIDAVQLAPIVEGMVTLQERPRTRVFTRVDDFKRYVSAMVFLPREAFNTTLREQVAQVLQDAFASTDFDFSVNQGDGPLARVHFMFRTDAKRLPTVDSAALEAKMEQLVRGWRARFQNVLADSDEQKKAFALQCLQAVNLVYQDLHTPEEAWTDIERWAQLTQGAVGIYLDPSDDVAAPWRLRLYHRNPLPSLSKVLPMIESLGVTVYEELPYEFQLADGQYIGISDIGLDVTPEDLPRLQNVEVQAQFTALLQQVFDHQVEIDGFNALVVKSGIAWRETVLLRALAKYLRQATLPFSQTYVEQCLQHNILPVVTLCQLWNMRLQPKHASEVKSELLVQQFKTQLDDVSNADEDRILHAFLTVMLAVVRTNFWQTDADGHDKTVLSFKLESAKIDFLPKPWPMFEIWVYSPRVEGVHLRGAKVARGGLRWSDRMEDFRTEVLGLVKAQMVKNAVIVPNGSKGGFVCKQAGQIRDRQAYLEEGIACYQRFIQGLLDLTDNRLADGSLQAPDNTHCRDEADPYLVVAADKGTAKFSDIANQIAMDNGFWLDDAFASGGSAGYDHKGMGITARGAWESVKRHFRHLGKDIQTEDFTVVGIGDMAGDVFGNGMLLSRHIRLLAAFNHQHIFLDPNPDATISFVERQRLFEGVLGWGEYDKNLISEGGGVFERSAKKITLSPQIKAWLQVDAESMTPNELIHILLKAKVELLYNGGIGTYVKASTESHADAMDKGSDALRVNGGEIQAQVIGEGGNLGMTQLGRIEYWQSGGRCNTDAVDNSAGVDCSDHEVNIKILLGGVVQAGDLTLQERNVLLKSMTDEVAALVLRNNYLQTQMLAMNQLDAVKNLPALNELMTYLETHANLHRGLEFLPSRTQMQQRIATQQGLANPEVAVLLAYSKMHLQDALLASSVPDDAAFNSVLVNYFPQALQDAYLPQIEQHYLRREIIANQLANQVVNRLGVSFVQRLTTEMNRSVADVVRAYWIVSQLYQTEEQFQQIESWDNQIPADVQMRLMAMVSRLMSRVARGLLRDYADLGDVAAWKTRYGEPLQQLLQQLPELINEEGHDKVAQVAHGLRHHSALDEATVLRLSRLPYAEDLLSLIDLSVKTQRPLEMVAEHYFNVCATLDSDWLYHTIANLPRENTWQNQACLAVREDTQKLLLKVTRHMLLVEDAEEEVVWQQKLQWMTEQVHLMQPYPNIDLAMLSALLRNLTKLVQQ